MKNKLLRGVLLAYALLFSIVTKGQNWSDYVFSTAIDTTKWHDISVGSTTIIGSNVMGTMMSDSAKRRLTKVNDADLVILARAIDELQETLLVNYMSYKNALQEFEMASKITAERKKTYEKLSSGSGVDNIKIINGGTA